MFWTDDGQKTQLQDLNDENLQREKLKPKLFYQNTISNLLRNNQNSLRLI